MTFTSLPPLFSCSSAPKSLTYSTPLSIKSKGSTLLRPWLSALENSNHVQQVHLVAQRPATARTREKTRLNLREFQYSIERALEVIARPIPNDQRRLFETSLFLSLHDEQLTIRCRVRPKTATTARIKLLHALDFSESRRIATSSLMAFWSSQKAWLCESGIQKLELRCDVETTKSTSQTHEAA